MTGRRLVIQEEDGVGYWPSFVDIMTVVILILLLVLITTFVQAAGSVQQQVVGRQRVQEIMDRRLEVTRALEAELGAEYVEINSDGNITLKGDMLFYPDSAELRNTEEVDQLLTRLATSIGNVVVQERFREGLQVILVEGHTAADNKAASTHWVLSAERARRIVLALQEMDPRLQDPENAKFLGAAARAHYQPAQAGDTEEAKRQNRRVEIRLVLKDEGLRDALMEALSQ